MNLNCDERKCNVIYLKTSRIFRHLGEYIAQHPLWFTFVPVVVTIVLSAGFFRLELTTDIDYIFFPVNGRSLVAKATIERLFPENSTDFDFSRAASPGKYGVVIATTISGDSMLFNSVFDDLHALDRTVLNMSVTLNGRRYTYADICRKYKGKCMQNHILNLQTKIEDLKKGHYKIKFPIDMDPNTSEFVAYAMSLGGVTKDEDDVVKDFKAVRLIYFLDYSDDMKHEIALLWEEKFLDLLSTIKYHHIKVTYFSGRTIEDELNSLTAVNLSLVMLAQIFMIIFAVATCMTADCVSSKPWIAIAGCMSSVFGTGTAFGLLVLCGMEYIDLNISVPLFVLGVGIDDSFVLLSAWRKSDPKYAIKERMGETYSEAAISITITTITNVTASIVGITTPYRSIQIICSYMAASFAFAYVYQLTFFGGCLTLSGKREIKGLHAIYCGRVKSNTSIGLKRILTVGCRPEKESNTSHSFYRDKLGNILSHNYVKCIVLIIFVIFFSFGIYLTKFIQIKLNYSDLYHKTSYAGKYSIEDYKYFSEYRERIQVVINKPLDYSDPKIQQKIEDLLKKLENSPNMAGNNLTESWLRIYLKFINDPSYWFSLHGYNTSDPQEFIEVLHNVFLKFKLTRNFRKDIVFDTDKNTILASRFFIQSKAIHNAKQQSELFYQLQNIADSSDFPVFIFCYELLFADSFLNVLPYVIRSVCVSSVLVIIVFLVFIPNILCAFCVVLSVLSIVTSTIGYCSVWDVHINALLMIVLILIAGFCVDYASHISCAYVSSKSEIPNERMKDALEAAGHAVIQGGCSTILGISVVPFGPYRIFLEFFKVIVLVMFFSMVYGLIFLPVILTVCDNLFIMCKSIHKKKTRLENEQLSDYPNVFTEFLTSV